MIRRVKLIEKPSNITWPKYWDISKQGMSQSLWSNWAKCPRLFVLKINGYKSYDNKDKFNFGNLIHEVNDNVYTKGTYPSQKEVLGYIDDYCKIELIKDNPISEQVLENDAAKAEATLLPYFRHYKKDFTNKKFYDAEELFKVKYNGILMRGKIDGKYLVKFTKWMMEHKTKGQINEGTLLDYLSMDFQNLYYLLADEIQTGKPAMGTLYNVIRNTSSKPKKHEGLLTYKKRIMATVESDPDHFFKRWEIAYTEQDRKIFAFNLDNIIKDFKEKVGKPVIENRFSCLYPFPCEMLRACSSNSCSDLTKSDDIESVLYPELEETKPIIGVTKNASKKISKKIIKKAVRKKTLLKRIKK